MNAAAKRSFALGKWRYKVARACPSCRPSLLRSSPSGPPAATVSNSASYNG
jgi:hypothetical protein